MTRASRAASARRRAAARSPATGFDDLEVALQLGLGAAGAHDHSCAAGEAEQERVGLGEIRVVEQVSERFDVATAQRGGRLLADGGHAGGDASQAVFVVEAERQRAGGVQAVLLGEGVEAIVHGLALGPQIGHQAGEGQRRPDAVLVVDGVTDEVPEGLLVAEDEAPLGVFEGGPDDPLEAGQRLGEVDAVGGGHPAQEPGGHHRRRHEPVVAIGVAQDVVGQQRTDLVTGEGAPVPVVLGDRHTEAVGIGIVGQDHIRTERLGPRQRQIEGAGLLGVGEGHGREIGIGLALVDDDVRCREAGPTEGGQEHVAAHAVHGGVHDVHLPGGDEATGDQGVEIGADDLSPEHLDSGVVERRPPRSALRRRRRRWRRRSRRRREGRSGRRRPGRPCSRCRPVGCGWR